MIDAIQKIFDEFEEAMTIEDGLYVYTEPCIAGNGLSWRHLFRVTEQGDVIAYEVKLIEQ